MSDAPTFSQKIKFNYDSKGSISKGNTSKKKTDFRKQFYDFDEVLHCYNNSLICCADKQSRLSFIESIQILSSVPAHLIDLMGLIWAYNLGLILL